MKIDFRLDLAVRFFTTNLLATLGSGLCGLNLGSTAGLTVKLPGWVLVTLFLRHEMIYYGSKRSS